MDLLPLFLKHRKVSTDTRKIEPDSLFFALKGPSFNGNEFAEEALEKGASYSIVDEPPSRPNERIIAVDNALKALQQLANAYRKYLNVEVVGITGSNGKTTTKELLLMVLSKKMKAQATPGNLNNHIGVPLTLLRLNQDTEIAMVEMGDNKPGDIHELCEIAEPNYGYITNVGKDHLEGYGTMERNVQTKNELYQYVYQHDGVVFYNSTDTEINRLVSKIKNKIDIEMLSETLVQIEDGAHIQYKVNDDIYQSKMVGHYNFLNMKAAYAIGKYFDVPEDSIHEALCNYSPENNRSQIKKTEHNTLLLDAYNSNPSSLRVALDSFLGMNLESNTTRKAVILGDMLELGKISDDEHRFILDFLRDKEVDAYFAGGCFYKHKDTYPYKFFKTTPELNKFLEQNPLKNTFILLKGSRGLKLESLIEVL